MALRVIQGGEGKKQSRLNRRKSLDQPDQQPRKGRGAALRFTEKELRDALVTSLGLISRTAETLHTTPSIIYKYLDRFPKLKEIKSVTDELLLDLAETKLYKMVEEGDREMVRFVLRCKGRERGWVEQKPVDGAKIQQDLIPKVISFSYREAIVNE